MKYLNETDVPFKYGDHGPKYLFNEEKFSGGAAYITPGKSIKEHVHADESEIFYFVKGTPEFRVDGKSHRVKPGDSFLVMPGEAHELINDTQETIQLVFLKIKQDVENRD